MQQHRIWYSPEWQSKEECLISSSAAGIEVQGSIRGTAPDAQDFEINYTLEFSPQWQIQHIVIRDARHDGNDLDLQYESGKWFDVDGWHLKEYDNIDYVDLSITPATNTPPLKRLSFANGETQKIDVLYVDLPAFATRRMEQYYTQLDAHTYKYQDSEHPKTPVVITVDAEGIVTEYPGLFTSRGPQ